MSQAAVAASAVGNRSAVLSTYRSLLRYSFSLSGENRARALKELRGKYRENAGASPDAVDALIEKADKRLAFLRMSTPKNEWAARGLSIGGNQAGETRWVYGSDGKEDGSEGTPRKGSGRVVSNWDGKNLDPCSVKRHYHGLKRLGFKNNLHAKGIF
eukprot:CAMPEP_0183295354 /NCGR_PEP_ID=MMETSP0160_2-20130417/3340_1 /TAXON_ID=2839 ORGANISM="Odontella Sinensis, Strain Grunow 1884" /NCGR_SAMPLE_ID=MMETSP0160_2 /ASSEMBLY_ACC=CAM_ASM_000250 /LENGTH=156 /DNA_ID=CAMNT_0025456823 /DNA_START=55 /DNA_END=525 /DNA_ORIENTATION=-